MVRGSCDGGCTALRGCLDGKVCVFSKTKRNPEIGRCKGKYDTVTNNKRAKRNLFYLDLS